MIKTIVSMTKQKSPPSICKTNSWGFFMDFSIMGYGYFPIRFHVPNVSKCNSNECLSVRTFGTVCELAVQTKIIVYELI